MSSSQSLGRMGRPEEVAAGDRFEVAVPPDRALDAFYHPFAYAA